MKKCIQLFVLIFLTHVAGFAQPAVDFTETDINGVEHNLFSYLDEGKVVLLDVSATWCGPCWGLHQRHTLNYLHDVLGPDAMDQVVVLFYEGDGNTTSEDLNGTGANTLGDWVTGTQYPIIDPPSVTTEFLNLYAPEGFPTVSVICPDNKEIIADVYDQDYKGMLDQIINCGTITSFSDPLAIGYSGADKVCEGFGFAPIFDVLNGGSEAIDYLEMDLISDGDVIQTKTDMDGLAAGEIKSFDFSDIALPGDNTNYSVEIRNSSDANTSNNTYDATVGFAQRMTTDITVYIESDQYTVDDPTTWVIEDDDGNVIAESGTIPINSTTETEVTLDPEGCYYFIMTDGYGDGMPGVIEIRDADGNVIALDGAFGGEGVLSLSTSTISGLEDLNINSDLSIAPSPVSDMLNLNFEAAENADMQLEISHISGALVHAQNINTIRGNNDFKLDVSDYKAGIYNLTLTNDNGSHTVKFVKL